MSVSEWNQIRMNASIGGPRFQAPVKPNSNPGHSSGRLGNSTGADFRKILNQQIENQPLSDAVSFTKHATLRMQQRGMQLDAAQMQQFHQAIDKAAAKGAKDALVLMQDQAYIVNVKQRTVITAMDAKELTDHVVTQIDSAVIVPATQK